MSNNSASVLGTNSDRLLPSTPDDYLLAEQVELNYLELCESYIRILGVQLFFPKSIYRDVLRWREMRVRHKAGDLRHTESELKSVKAIAQWTVNVNMEIRRQPAKRVKWKD